MENVLAHFLDQLRQDYGLAGGIMVAVKDGRCVVKEPFGLRDVEQKKPVDNKTLFQIASCSKAFTTMVVGQLADQRKLSWDTPVKQLLPDFALADPYVTEHITPRDMGCHRSGLCRHDAMRTYVREDRADLVRRMAYFPPAFGFREKYSYQNQMYVALGYLCERLTGQTWEGLVRRGIGEPLGMDLEFRGHCDIKALNAAQPYGQKDGQLYPLPEVQGAASNPCGGIYTNADSLEKWLYLLCGGGSYQGKEIISPEGFAELCRPNVVIPGKAAHPEEQQRCYALAWINCLYKGRRLLYHSGSTNGFLSMVGFFPEENAAYAVSINTENCPAFSSLAIILRDLLLGEVEEDYSFLLDDYKRRMARSSFTTTELEEDIPLTAEKAQDYCGQFYNPGYGILELCYEEQHLKLRYGLQELSFRQVAPKKFLGIDEKFDLCYRMDFTADGCPRIRFTQEADCPILFEKLR